MRRIVAVALPRIRIELVRSELPEPERDGPLALVIARQGSALKDERSLLGNTRLDVRPQQTIAAARARCSSLRVRVVSLSLVRGALARIAESLLVFGATTSLDVETSTVWVDVTGCAHLHGGEEALSANLERHMSALGHECRIAMAAGPRIAAAIAHHGAGAGPFVVPPGKDAALYGPLPIVALPLTPSTIHWLSKLGLKTVSDLRKLPKSSLAIRLGAAAPEVMALLEGDDPAPLCPHVPPVVPEETATLEYGIESTDAILFVLKRLCDGLSCRLAGRALSIGRLEVVFELDRGLQPSAPRAVLDLGLSAPLAEAGELLRVIRARLDSYTIEAPILAVTVRGTETVPRTSVATHLFVPESKAERIVPRLAAELTAELGPGTVGTLEIQNRWRPEVRSTLLPLGAARPWQAPRLVLPDSHDGTLLTGAPEPTRWLSRPFVSSARAEVVARIDSVEWWIDGLPPRAYGTAWIERVPATAWVEVDERGQVTVRGWMD